MAKESLTLADLREIAGFLENLSDKELDQAIILVIKKFPDYTNTIGKVTDLAGLVKFERYRRKLKA